MRHVELLVSLAATALCPAAGTLVLGGCGVVTADLGATSASAVSKLPSVAPPAWLLERMQREARNLGDSHALAWWVLTTAEKAVTAEGDWPSGQPVADPDRAVYVTLLNGAFKNWIWSYPASASDPGGAPRPGPWVVDLIDAKSHLFDVEGNTAKRPDTSQLVLNAVNLAASTSQDVPAWLLEKAIFEAQRCGDPHPELAEWAISHKLAAVRVLSGDEMYDDDPQVVVLALKGHFVDEMATRPAGAAAPKGAWLYVVFDARTHDGIGFGLGDKPLQLSRLGSVHSFTF